MMADKSSEMRTIDVYIEDLLGNRIDGTIRTADTSIRAAKSYLFCNCGCMEQRFGYQLCMTAEV